MKALTLVVALLLASALGAAAAVQPLAINTVDVTVIASNNQPMKDLPLRLVKNNEDTTRAVASNTTNNDGKARLRADITDDGVYWVVSTGPVVYKDFNLLASGSSQSFTFFLNDTSAYTNVTITGFIDRLPNSAVRGNITLVRNGVGRVTVVDASLGLNIVYFPNVSGANATLRVKREFSVLGSVNTLVNVTIVFRNDTRRAYNATAIDIDPALHKSVAVYYKSSGMFLGLPLTAWIAIGILLAAAGGFVAVARSRRAASAILRERRVLRGLDRYVIDNGGVDWQSLVDNGVPLEERAERARRVLRRAG
jgi:hypothetical protein